MSSNPADSRPRFGRRRAIAGLAALAAGGAAVGVALWPAAGLAPRMAPDFLLPLLEDPARQFSSRGLRGRVWILNVWASWCRPCREEHPTLLALGRSADVPLVGLNYRDTPHQARAWLQQLGDPFRPCLVDADGRVATAFGAKGVPATFVVDATGAVRDTEPGPLSAERLAREILPLVRSLGH